MKEILTKFTCDFCTKEVILTESEIMNGFPYEKEWVYVYNLGIKVKDEIESEIMNGFPYEKEWVCVYNLGIKVKGEIITEKDKHFCNKKCMIKFFEKMIGGK